MCTEINTAMGLQATAATKRKHEVTFDSNDANTYTTTNCSAPLKAAKWSLNNNNYLDAVEEQLTSYKIGVNGIKYCGQSENEVSLTLLNSNNNNNSSSNSGNKGIENKSCDAETTSKSTTVNATPFLNAIAASIPAAAEVDATTPLPPITTTPVPEDSIAKLEVVAAVSCEPWTSTPEPVDCISKLQAVAVPTDPWGGISTRSTLATTLLSADELDDDDDDFEDDYEEDESIIPTYCPLRYHPFPSSNNTSITNQSQRIANFPPSSNYAARPNYYSEPFPQQNCSRTGNTQHMRMGSSFSWQNSGSTNFYGIHESPAFPPQHQPMPQQQQQTIRCAENGKSYLELGCSSPAPNQASNTPLVPLPSTSTFASAQVGEVRPPIKRCCDARSNWCNTAKPCYKDIRLKVRNLSMFKLSRFRQVSEQSLYRSVLICNTLKRIDREIEAETKELHQVSAAHVSQQQHQQQQQQQHQHHPQYQHSLHSHMQHQAPPLLSHTHQQHSAMQQHHQPQPPQPMLHPQHQDYMPILNCNGRLSAATIDFHSHHHQQQQNFQHSFQQHSPERLDALQSTYQTGSMQKSLNNNQHQLIGLNSGSSSACSMVSAASTLPPYDHYPFRESHSGRATPFPCHTVISSQPPSPPPSTITLTTAQVQSSPPPSQQSGNTTSSATTSLTSLCDSDSGYADDDTTRSINWSSVLSLSSQSALDPLNSNDLFSILPPVNPATAVPVAVSATNSSVMSNNSENSTSQALARASGSFTTELQLSSTCSSLSTNSNCSNTTPPSSTTAATFTTLSTISSATHSLTASYMNSMNSHMNPASTWEYGFLDMEFGLGSEFTELVPSCKYSSEELFKNTLTPVAATTRYENELEQPAHIMVGS